MNLRTLLRGPRLLQSLCLLGLLAPMAAQAETVDRRFCVWDPVGAGGPVVSMMKELQVQALQWGVNFKLDAYTDEKVASLDFKAGQCDAVLLTAVSIRDYNHFTATLDAIGAIPGNEQMRTLVTTLSQPKAADLMRQDNYEIAAILPIGSIFMFVRDQAIDSVEELQGKKMAVLDNDPVAASMVRKVGGSVVPASLSSFAGLFNNGSVDVIFAPAVAYNTMELYKGMENHGGVVKYPLVHGNMQMVLNWTKFPDGFGQKLRDYSLTRLDDMEKTVLEAEAEIPAQYWINVDAERKKHYDEMMRTSRISLKDEGFYDARALQLMKKIRCKFEPGAAECVQTSE